MKLNQIEQDLNVLIGLIQAMHETSDLEEIYDIALDSVLSVGIVDIASIYLVDEKSREAVIQSYRNLTDKFVKKAGRIPYPKGLTWEIINSGRVLNVPDIQSDPGLGPAGREIELHSSLGIPIFLGERAKGVIWFSRSYRRGFSEEEVKLLSTIGNQIGIAIARAKQAKGPEERNKKLSLLSSVSQKIHETVDLEDVNSSILNITNDLKFIDIACVYLVETGDENGVEKKEAVLQFHSGFPDDYLERASRIPYPSGITWRVINSKEPIYYENMSDPSTTVGPAGKALGKRALLSIPVKSASQEDAIGVIHFISFKKCFFSRQEMDFLLSLGNQFGTAITKAKMFEEMKKREEDLEQSLIQLSKKNRYEEIANAVTRTVHQSIDLEEVFENAVESMSRNMHRVDCVALYLVEGEEAVMKAYRGYPHWFIERTRRIPYGRGATWKTIIDGRYRYCADAERDTVMGPAGKELGTKSYLSMPVYNDGEAIGCININSFQKNSYNEDELRLLQIVARQIEAAINNAQKAEALRQSEERYRTLFDQSPVGVYLFDSSCNIIQCNEQFLKILHPHLDNVQSSDCNKLCNKLNYQYFLPSMRKTLEGETPRHEGIYEAVDGSIGRWLAVRMAPLRDSEDSVVAGMGVVEDITERKAAEEELKNSREQLRNLAVHVQQVREEERARIAREIHDELGQALTGLRIALSWVDKKLPEVCHAAPCYFLQQEIASMTKLVDSNIQTVREISSELRPRILDDFGLAAAIEWQAKKFQSQWGIRCRFTSTPENMILEPDQSTALFRIFQEALTNVVRHSQATRVDISLKKADGRLVLEVNDNGRGITESSVSSPKSIGLLGMRERALLLGGNFEWS